LAAEVVGGTELAGGAVAPGHLATRPALVEGGNLVVTRREWLPSAVGPAAAASNGLFETAISRIVPLSGDSTVQDGVQLVRLEVGDSIQIRGSRQSAAI